MKSMAWTAVVRTIVQGVIGMVLSSAFGVRIVELITSFGLAINVEVLTNAVTLFLIGAIVWLVNTFGPKFAWINKLVSLGLSRTGPAYVPNNADAVVAVANPEGTDTVSAVDVPPPGPNPEVTPITPNI
jgi:hypothetical protein